MDTHHFLHIARVLIAAAAVIGTLVLIAVGTLIPDPWWPVIVAIVSYLFPARPANANRQENIRGRLDGSP
jgi:hypothetical protein